MMNLLQKTDDTAVTVMPLKLSDVHVGQKDTPKTYNAKGKTTELNMYEEKRRNLKYHFRNTQDTAKTIVPALPPLQIQNQK